MNAITGDDDDEMDRTSRNLEDQHTENQITKSTPLPEEHVSLRWT